jgi:sugar phosphate isomerase/epimerase
MRIALGSWAFSFGPYAADPVPFDVIVRRLAESGYDGIDISGFPPQITLDSHPRGDSRTALKTLLRDHGLGVAGYTADFYINPAVAENTGPYKDLLKRYVEMCVDIGSPALRVDTVAAPGSIEDADCEAAFHRIAGLWSDGAEFAASAGVRLVWEFEPGFAYNKPGEVIRMHQEVRHPNFSVLFDVSHAYMCSVVGARQQGALSTLPGGVEEFLDALQGRIGAVHLNDSDGTLHCDETSTHRPLGEGRVDLDKLIPKLLAVPNVEWWTIDMSFWPGAWELIDSSRALVLDLIAKHSSVSV